MCVCGQTGGLEGAAGLAGVLHERGVQHVEFVLDEGMVILDGLMPGVQCPVGM